MFRRIFKPQNGGGEAQPVLHHARQRSGRCVVGVSNLCTDFKYLREAYDEARAAVRAAFLLGYGRVIFYRDLSQKPFVPSQDMQRELYDRILANDFTQATNFLNSYIDSLSACREQDIPQIREALAPLHIGSAVRASRTSRTAAVYFGVHSLCAEPFRRARLSARTAAKAHRQHLEPR